MHILVVDDTPSVLESLTHILQQQGHSCETANNGLAALEKIQEETYDMFIIDHLMPVMDGVQFCKNLSQSSTHNDKPIIFMTTKDKNTLLTLSELSSVLHVLEKPISENTLINLLDMHFSENTLLHSL